MCSKIPETQTAVQLVGVDKLILNTQKPVYMPGDYQILCRVEAVSLCFSDLKLLKQFSKHVRKGQITSGIAFEILKEIPSYVPDEAPTVPGHEAVVRICALGNKVTGLKLGGRYLIQADYRWLSTASSNAAFGYNFEGALQEYVLMDQRIITSPQGESMLIPASDELSASAIALVEPWACVEEAYAVRERATLKPDGQMLVIADRPVPQEQFNAFLARFGKPGRITWVSRTTPPVGLNATLTQAESISRLPEASYDDLIYFGSNPEVVEILFTKVGANGLFNIVLGQGGRLGRPVSSRIGRIHYGNIRLIGTTGSDPAEAMSYIPSSGEVRQGDRINIVGAAGPMGTMHVIRNICQAVEGIAVFAGDLDDNRLASLSKIASPLAQKNNIRYHAYNPTRDKITDTFDYIVLMAPVPRLVAESIHLAGPGGIINIFAGIPAHIDAEIDLDTYIEKQLYFIGTSGSTLEDMKTVLRNVEASRLDTNISVAAVCGLTQAVEGIRAVEKHLIPGKIIVYPACKDLLLLPLDKLGEHLPQVVTYLQDRMWSYKAEKALLGLYEKKQ